MAAAAGSFLEMVQEVNISDSSPEEDAQRGKPRSWERTFESNIHNAGLGAEERKRLEQQLEEDLYWAISEEQRERAQIIRHGDGVPELEPLRNFNDLQLLARFRDRLHALGIRRPTAIQQLLIPYVLLDTNAHIIVREEEGGKADGRSLAYLLPLIKRVVDAKLDNESTITSADDPTRRVLILCSSRARALRVHAEAARLTRHSLQNSLKVQLLDQESDDAIPPPNEADVLVSTTPGRLFHYFREVVEEDQSTMFKTGMIVVDGPPLENAEESADLNGNPNRYRVWSTLRKIMDGLAARGQNKPRLLLFGSDFPPHDPVAVIRKLFGDVARNWMEIRMPPPPEALLKIKIISAKRFDKQELLMQLVERISEAQMAEFSREELENIPSRPMKRTLVCVEETKQADRLAHALILHGFTQTVAINENWTEERYLGALKKVYDKTTDIMIITSAAARRFDLPKVDHFVNFDLPKEFMAEDYAKRVGGNCGRIGGFGFIYNFFDARRDADSVKRLIEYCQSMNQPVPDDVFTCLFAAEKRHRRRGRVRNSKRSIDRDSGIRVKDTAEYSPEEESSSPNELASD